MLVSAGGIFHNGRTLGRGEPIPDIEDWSGYIVQIHRDRGAILDVTHEEAERMQAQQRQKDAIAQLQNARRKARDAKAASQRAGDLVASLTIQLADAEQAQQVAEEQEFEAADKLSRLEVELADILPDEPEPAPEPPKPVEESTADSDALPAPLTAQERRAKTLGLLGGHTRGALLKGFGPPEDRGTKDPTLVPEGEDIDLLELLPEGAKTRKVEVRTAACVWHELFEDMPAATYDDRVSAAKVRVAEALGLPVPSDGAGATDLDDATGDPEGNATDEGDSRDEAGED